MTAENDTGICAEINELRNAFAPFSDIVLRCYKQGLTVTQCAVFLHATQQEITKLPIQILSSAACRSAIREVFWCRIAEDRESLLSWVPGLPRSLESCSKHMLSFLLDEHPSVISWIPLAYRQHAERELGLELGE